MAKILYPVGTPVTLRKYPEIEGLIVSQYNKGEKYPYRVGFYKGDCVGTKDGKTKFSVKGLKRDNSVEEGTVPKTTTNTVAEAQVRIDALNKVDVDEGIKKLSNMNKQCKNDAVLERQAAEINTLIGAVHELMSDVRYLKDIMNRQASSVTGLNIWSSKVEIRLKRMEHNDD